jgi:pyruvate formate lyase activating enzyme
VRDWYRIEDYRLTADGHCPHCQTQIAGHFEKFTRQFGNRRIPIAIPHHA